MIKLPKKKPKTLIRSLERSPRVLARNSFLTFLALLLISLMLGAIIFYQYSILAKTSLKVSTEEDVLTFKTKTYQTILTEWQERNRRISETKTKNYPNPFYLTTPSQ